MGDKPKGKTFKKLGLKELPLAFVPRVPWPNRFGLRNNASRSNLLCTQGGDPEKLLRFIGRGSNNYRGLLAGLDDWIYCMSRPENKLFAYHFPDTATSWTVQTGSDKPPCLDHKGNIYYISVVGRQLIKAAGNTGTPVWWRSLPYDASSSVEVIGERIYTATVTPDPFVYVTAWDMSGNQLWTVGPYNGKISGIAEDSHRRYVYIQTSQALCQIGWSGTENWERVFDDVSPSNSPGPLAPIVGRGDGTVWAFHAGSDCSYAINKANEVVGIIDFDDRDMEDPISVCLGDEDELYIATLQKLYCFKDWRYPFWTFGLADASYSLWGGSPDDKPEIRDIAIDGDGSLLIWFYGIHSVFGFGFDGWGFVSVEAPFLPAHVSIEEFFVLTLEHDEPGLEGTDPFTGNGEMVIGLDEKVFFLHVGGELHYAKHEES
jgi:hypothetical protein